MSDACPSCGQPVPETKELVIDEDRKCIIYDGHVIKMHPGNLQVLALLHSFKGRIVSKEKILDELYWRRVDDEMPDEKIVAVFISKLRKILRPYGIEIETSWGRGYALKLPKEGVT